MEALGVVMFTGSVWVEYLESCEGAEDSPETGCDGM